MNSNRQLEEIDADRQRQAQQASAQREQLEAQRKEKEDLVRDRERAGQVMAANEKDKQGWEANKQQLLQQISGLQSELEKLVTQLQESQRNRERVEAERDDLKRVTEKHLKDQERVQVCYYNIGFHNQSYKLDTSIREINEKC